MRVIGASGVCPLNQPAIVAPEAAMTVESKPDGSPGTAVQPSGRRSGQDQAGETQTRGQKDGAGQGRGDGGTPRVGPNKWAVLAILAVGVFMATLDASIVNISLPAIGHSFGVPLGGSVEWVIIAYLVVVAGTLLTVGRLADLIGRKPIWAIGLVLFTIGSALCGLAPSLALLIVARGVQGLGGSLVMAVSPALLLGAFPSGERGKALGYNALVVALGTSAGPTFGGIITEHLTWRWIFFVNVPLGVIGLVATLRFLTDRTQTDRGRFSLRRFDAPGALLLAVGLAALTLGLSFGQEWGWTSPLLLGTLALAAVALVALVLLESRVTGPIIDLSLLKNRVFTSAIISLVLTFLALFAVSFILPYYLEELRGFPTQEAGLLLTPLPLTIAVVAPFSGNLADRFGSRWLAASGLTIACVGLVLLSTLDARSSVFDIAWRLVVTGVGQALFQSPNNSALLGAAPEERRGVASGFLATGRVVGQSVSVALAGAVFASLGGAAAGRRLVLLRETHGQPAGAHAIAALQGAFVDGFHGALVVCAALAALGILTSLVRGKES